MNNKNNKIKIKVDYTIIKIFISFVLTLIIIRNIINLYFVLYYLF